MQIITYDQVKSKIIEIRNQKIILDSYVAELYGVIKDLTQSVYKFAKVTNQIGEIYGFTQSII